MQPWIGFTRGGLAHESSGEYIFLEVPWNQWGRVPLGKVYLGVYGGGCGDEFKLVLVSSSR